jgi:hypothetical protein
MKTYTFRISIPDLPDTWRTVELTSEQTLRDLHVAIQEALDWDPDDDIAFIAGENPLESGDIYDLSFDDDWDLDDDEEDWDEEEGDKEAESMLEDLPPLDLGDTPRPETMDDALALIESNPEVRAQVRQMLVDQMGVPGFMADMMLGSLRSLMEMLPEGALVGMMGEGPQPKNAAEASLESLGLATGQSLLYVYGEDDWRFDVRLQAINDNAEDDAMYPLLLDGDGPAPEQYFDDDEDDDRLWGAVEGGEDDFEDEV